MRFMFIGIAFFIMILQMTLLSFLEIGSISPDLLLLVVVLVSLYLPTSRAMMINWSIGLLKDLASHSTLGTLAFLFMFVGLIVSLVRFPLMLERRPLTYQGRGDFSPAWFGHEDISVRVILSGSVVFVCHGLYGLGLYFYYSSFSLAFILLRAGLIAVYTSFFAVFLFFLLQLGHNYTLMRKIKMDKVEMVRSRRSKIL
ncbi:MAG: rod shape-determining protein MreD [Planctomycetes bacterium]|nr:rod shape-determining protein MreD [Planctomycetota bacterium]